MAATAFGGTKDDDGHRTATGAEIRFACGDNEFIRTVNKHGGGTSSADEYVNEVQCGAYIVALIVALARDPSGILAARACMVLAPAPDGTPLRVNRPRRRHAEPSHAASILGDAPCGWL